MCKDELTTIREINNQFNHALYTVLLQFLMYFNVFESEILRGASGSCKMLRETANELAHEQSIKENTLNDCATFFAKRYVDTKGFSPAFEGLFRVDTNGNGRDQRSCEKVVALLTTFVQNKDGMGKEDKLFMLLMISYRFRDNLFHGNKRLISIPDYEECFQKINELMDHLLSQGCVKVEKGTV